MSSQKKSSLKYKPKLHFTNLFGLGRHREATNLFGYVGWKGSHEFTNFSLFRDTRPCVPK